MAPNGLCAGAYLAKAGLKVLMLEKRLEAGGLATEEVTIPPFLHNTHSIYHLMVDYAPPYQDFEDAGYTGIAGDEPSLGSYCSDLFKVY